MPFYQPYNGTAQIAVPVVNQYSDFLFHYIKTAIKPKGSNPITELSLLLASFCANLAVQSDQYMPPLSSYSAILKTLLLTGLITIVAYSANGQGTGQRPKIGVALSGGGSHGFAHIGVLRVMEEAGLYPDLITGVSMGSVVGSLYSIGYSLDSMQIAIRTIDWDLMLSDKIPENKVIFPEKRYFFNNLISLPLSSGNLNIPSGMINGQQIDNMLNYYLWPAASINDFSKMPVPFLAIGTDIITSRRVKLDRGYLAKAIRASIAIPSIFTPVRMDSALLVDGGVVRNIAASELREMGADIIIGSYVGFVPQNAENLESMTAILRHVAFFTSRLDYESEKKHIDILIEPDTEEFSALVFNNTDTLIARGYRAALPYRETFIRIADSLNRIGERVIPENLLANQTNKFDAVEVEGNKRVEKEKILGILDIEPGQVVTKENINEKMELLYGKILFDKITYRMEPRNDSLVFIVECIEKPPSMIYSSLHYDNALSSGLLLSLVFRNIFATGMNINIDSYLGEYYRLRATAEQFVDKNQRFSASVGFSTETTKLLQVSLKDETGAMLSRDVTTGVALNKRIGLNHMVSLRGEYQNFFLSPTYISPSGLRLLRYNYLTASYNYQVNTLDTKHFPRSGIVTYFSGSISKQISGHIRTGTERIVTNKEDNGGMAFDRFFTLHGYVKQHLTISRRVTLGLKATALYVSDTDSTFARNNFYLLGGIQPVAQRSIPVTGFHAMQIPVKKAGGVGLESNITTLKDLYVTCQADLFLIQEPGVEHQISLLGGYGVGMAYMSIAGPIRVGLMHGFYNKEQFLSPLKGYLSIGFTF
jgi:NTE family protein